MLIAFNRASDLLRAGQTSTQIPQPVQSSTATCSVYFNPFHSGDRASADLNDEGAPGRTAASYELLRADRRTRISRTEYKLADPRQALQSRGFASRIASCRSDTCRR